MLAHHFTRVEQEGDWILQQHCLETRHIDRAAAVSGDQYGEHTYVYITQGKQAGGLKGISTNHEQVAAWN